ELPESRALGAALLAGVGVGAWSQQDVASREGVGARFEPRMGEDERAALVGDWRRAVQVARGFARG
ncbi:MAG: glycerol kinase, partial [Solirubrobacteraceae bacterium]|nr:glycerol kinase [Solirubrobacteraceae bacterium]